MADESRRTLDIELRFWQMSAQTPPSHFSYKMTHKASLRSGYYNCILSNIIESIARFACVNISQKGLRVLQSVIGATEVAL